MSAKKFTFSGVLFDERTKFHPEPQQMAQLYPSETPFLTAAMARFNKNTGKLEAPDYKFFEHRAGWRHQKFSVNGSPSAWSTPSGGSAGSPGGTVSVDIDGIVGMPASASAFWLNHEVEIWSEDHSTYKGTAVVTTVTDANTIVLTAVSNAGVATEQVSALADNDVLYVIGTAFGEDVEAPEASSDELEFVYNSAHNERTTIEIGKTLQRAVLRGRSDELARLRDLKGKEHKMKKARNTYFGGRPGGIGGVAHGAGGGTDSTFVNHIVDVNGNTIRKTMGIFPALRRYGRTSGDQQNVFSFSKAAMTYNDWIEMAEKTGQYTPDGGMMEMYAGPGFLSFLSQIGSEGFLTKSSGARVKISISDPTPTRAGLIVQEIHTPHVAYRITRDPLLRNTPYHSDALVINPDNSAYAQYEPTQFHGNIKTDNNPRVIKDEIEDFYGIKLGLMESHSWIHLT